MQRPAEAHTSRGWTLAITSVAGFMTALDALVIATALPAIQRELQASAATLSWTVSAFQLALAAGIVTGTALGDRFGRRRLFIIGLMLFTAASAACAVAPSAPALIAARAIQGLGAAIVSPISLTILASAFPPARRGAVVGIWGGIAGLAVAGGPLVGGALTQGLSWHWIFWVNVPVGLALSAAAWVRLGESFGPRARLDLPAVIFLAAAAGSISWALFRGNDAGWASAEILGTVGLGFLLLVGFAVWEARAPAPMLPLALFRNLSFAAANASGFLMAASLIPAAFLISQYLQIALHDSPFAAGLRFLPMTATPLLVAPAAGMLADRIGTRPLIVLGLLMHAAGMTWFAAVASTTTSYRDLVLPLLVAGIGISMPFATTATAALSAVPPSQMGQASGTANTLRNFGAAFGIAITTAVFSTHGGFASPAAFTLGFRPALVVAATLALVGASAALGVSHRAPATTPQTMPEAA